MKCFTCCGTGAYGMRPCQTCDGTGLIYSCASCHGHHAHGKECPNKGAYSDRARDQAELESGIAHAIAKYREALERIAADNPASPGKWLSDIQMADIAREALAKGR